MNPPAILGKRPRGRPRTRFLLDGTYKGAKSNASKGKGTSQDAQKGKGAVVKVAPNVKEVNPIEVISLDDGDGKAKDNITGEEDIEVISDNKNNSENDSAMEVISLVDEDSSSDDDKDSALGTPKVSFLDHENRKIHKNIKLVNAENENELVNVEDLSSDSDIEEIIDNEKKVYITIDPEDYKKVIKEKSSQEEPKTVLLSTSAKEEPKRVLLSTSPKEEPKRVLLSTSPKEEPKRVLLSTSPKEEPKRVVLSTSPNSTNKNKTIQHGKKNIKKNKSMIDSSASSNNVEGIDLTDSFVDHLNELVSSPEPPDSLKGPNIPKALCCHSCSFVCFKEHELNLHIAITHSSKVESLLRTYTAAEIQELEREMRDQADDCSSCSQALWYLPTLRAHALTHSTGKMDCDACHHGTSVIKLLMDHLESHVGSEEEEDSDV